jgi:hypothetical protein
MLEFAGQIYPSIVGPTIERYWNKLHELNPNIVGRGLGGTTTVASDRPTKKLRNTSTTLHKEKENQCAIPPCAVVQSETKDVITDPRSRQALVVMRDFLRSGNSKASHIKSIPKELTKADAVTTQVSNHWLPAINFYFGSVEYFLFHLSKAEVGKQALQRLLASGKVVKNSLLKPEVLTKKEWKHRREHKYLHRAYIIWTLC